MNAVFEDSAHYAPLTSDSVYVNLVDIARDADIPPTEIVELTARTSGSLPAEYACKVAGETAPEDKRRFSNDGTRRATLEDKRDAVQAKANGVLGSSSSGVDVDDLARRVIAGEFGNGRKRRN